MHVIQAVFLSLHEATAKAPKPPSAMASAIGQINTHAPTAYEGPSLTAELDPHLIRGPTNVFSKTF